MVTKKERMNLFRYYEKQGERRLNVTGLDPGIQRKKLGERIKQLRIQKGYTSYEYFAYEHNISRAQFGRYENGQDLRFSSLIRVVSALGMSVSEFFSEALTEPL